MRRLTYLARSTSVLNLGLLFVIILGLVYVLWPLRRVSIPYPARSASTQPAQGNGQTAPGQVPSLVEYAMVGEQNLFHPERRIPPEAKDEKQLPRPELVLYGTLIADGTGYAYLEDLKAPYSTPGRGRRQVVVKQGESISGFTLVEVGPNKAVLSRGGDMIVVTLDDGQKRKNGDASRAGVGAGGVPTSPRPGGILPGAMAAPGTAGTPPTGFSPQGMLPGAPPTQPPQSGVTSQPQPYPSGQRPLTRRPMGPTNQ